LYSRLLGFRDLEDTFGSRLSNPDWDLIHYRCPLSPLEARVLVLRYVFGMGELEVAAKLNVPWRKVNRASWRLKAKLRNHIEQLHSLPSAIGNIE
jgi:hypothetical protein